MKAKTLILENLRTLSKALKASPDAKNPLFYSLGERIQAGIYVDPEKQQIGVSLTGEDTNGHWVIARGLKFGPDGAEIWTSPSRYWDSMITVNGGKEEEESLSDLATEIASQCKGMLYWLD